MEHIKFICLYKGLLYYYDPADNNIKYTEYDLSNMRYNEDGIYVNPLYWNSEYSFAEVPTINGYDVYISLADDFKNILFSLVKPTAPYYSPEHVYHMVGNNCGRLFISSGIFYNVVLSLNGIENYKNESFDESVKLVEVPFDVKVVSDHGAELERSYNLYDILFETEHEYYTNNGYIILKSDCTVDQTKINLHKLNKI